MTTMTSAQAPRIAGPARQRDFRRLWLGYSISAFGSEITVLAVPLTAAVLLGASAFQMGLLTAAATLPNLAIGLVAGVWVDRLPRRRPVLVATDLASAAALLSIPIAWWLGALTVTQLVVVELGVGCARVIFRPAYQSHLPQVVERDHLTTASGHLRTSDSGAMLAGPGLGGLLVQAVSAPVAIVLDAASFLVSAACIRSLRSPERRITPTTPNRSMGAELGEGLSTVLRNPSLRAIAGSAANLNLFGMLVMALFVAYATRTLGLSAGMIGAVMMTGGVGALGGALAAPRIAARIGAGHAIVAATVVFSFALFALPLAAGPRWVELGVIGGGELVGGFAVMVFDVTAAGLTFRAVAPDLLGRVSACNGFLTQGVKPLGALAGGVLGTTLGLHTALWIAAAGATTTMLWTVLSPLRRRETPDADSPCG